jgi:hypothetical protein
MHLGAWRPLHSPNPNNKSSNLIVSAGTEGRSLDSVCFRHSTGTEWADGTFGTPSNECNCPFPHQRRPTRVLGLCCDEGIASCCEEAGHGSDRGPGGVGRGLVRRAEERERGCF